MRRRANRRVDTKIIEGRVGGRAEGRVGGREAGRATTTPCNDDLVTANDEVHPHTSSSRRPWRQRPRSLREKPNTVGHDNATHPGCRDPDPRPETSEHPVSITQNDDGRCRSFGGPEDVVDGGTTRGPRGRDAYEAASDVNVTCLP